MLDGKGKAANASAKINDPDGSRKIAAVTIPGNLKGEAMGGEESVGELEGGVVAGLIVREDAEGFILSQWPGEAQDFLGEGFVGLLATF